MANLVRKIYTKSDNFICPAGVNEIRVFGLRKVNYIATGDTRSWYIDSSGYAWTTGGNAGGLGDNTTTNRSSFVAVAGSRRVIQVNNQSYIDESGDMYTWGFNGSGEVGDNSTTTRSSPVSVAVTRKFRQIARGEYSSHAIDVDGFAWGWGDNGFGQLGDNTITLRSSPVAVSGSRKWVSIAAESGEQDSRLGLGVDGNIYGWGAALYSGVGANASSPTVLNSYGNTWKKIQTLGNGYVLLNTSGQLLCWGDNTYGQLGNNSTTTISTSMVLVAGSKKWVNVFKGKDSVFAIDINGDAYGWGRNNNGQLGDNTTTNRSSPTLVVGSYKWKYISNGYQTLAVDNNNLLYGWGLNSSGELGDNTTTNKSSPVLINTGTVRPYGVEDIKLNEVYVPVVAGQTYPIVVLAGIMTFGNSGIAPGISETSILIEYYQ